MFLFWKKRKKAKYAYEINLQYVCVSVVYPHPQQQILNASTYLYET